MVKLTAKGDRCNTRWYFKSEADCEIFKAVFRDHHCNVEWNPIEISDYPFFDQPANRYTGIDRDPKERALADLSWGFNSYMEEHGGKNTITESQQLFIDGLMSKVIEKDDEPKEEDAIDYDKWKRR